MPPVPIYSQSPINAAKASGVTPKTAAVAAADNNSTSPYGPPTPTKTSSAGAGTGTGAGAGPPPPQPGAAPSLPQPTGTAYAPAPIMTAANYGPPPPQPGAVPVPPVVRSSPYTNNSSYGQQQPQQTAAPSLPPPPRAGETLDSTSNGAATTTMPPQMAMPPLTSAHYPATARGTATTTQPSYPYSAGNIFAANPVEENPNLDHPPGYVQNAYAADMDSSQREAALASSSRMSDYDNSRSNISFLHGSGGEDSEGIWDAAKKMAAAAGGRLSAAETEVWRRLNKEE